MPKGQFDRTKNLESMKRYYQRTETARFFAKVDKTPGVGPWGDCWIWTASKCGGGYQGKTMTYGRVRFRAQTLMAHHASFILAGKVVPKGLDLHHKCEIPLCVNPDHLEPMTRSDHRRISKISGICGINKQKTHCKRGHPFDEKNTYVVKTGRHCRTCRSECAMRHYRKRKRKGKLR